MKVTSEVGRRGKILLYEEDPVWQRIMVEALRGEALQTVCVDSPMAAFAALQFAGPFDLAVVIEAPGSKTLGAFGAALQEAGAALPLLAVQSPGAKLPNSVQGYVSDALPWPIGDLELFVTRVKSLLGELRMEREQHEALTDLVQAARGAGWKAVETDKAVREARSPDVVGLPDLWLAQLGHETLELGRSLFSAAGLRVFEATSLGELLSATPEARRSLPPIAAVVVLDIDRRAACALIEKLKQLAPMSEILLTTRRSDPAVLVPGLEAGATDFFMWELEAPELLLARTNRALRRVERRRALLQSMQALQKMATTPPRRVTRGSAQARDRRSEARHRSNLHARVACVRSLKEASAAGAAGALQPGEKATRENSARVLDVSRAGVFLAFAKLPPLGSRVTIELDQGVQGVQGEPGLLAGGEVVRLARFEPDPEGHSGVGVRLDPKFHGLVEALALSA